MQLSDRSGICCDSCGITYKNDFVYYSFDFRLVDVYNNQRPSIDSILSFGIVFSADICTNCFDGIKKTIVDNYAKIMSPKRLARPSSIIVCEMTGNKLAGTYTYYYCVVSKANIKLSGQPNICVKCKTKTFDKNKPCVKCSGNEFIKMAAMNVDNRHVEIIMCQDAFKEFTTRAERVRMSTSTGQWTTES